MHSIKLLKWEEENHDRTCSNPFSTSLNILDGGDVTVALQSRQQNIGAPQAYEKDRCHSLVRLWPSQLSTDFLVEAPPHHSANTYQGKNTEHKHRETKRTPFDFKGSTICSVINRSNRPCNTNAKEDVHSVTACYVAD